MARDFTIDSDILQAYIPRAFLSLHAPLRSYAGPRGKSSQIQVKYRIIRPNSSYASNCFTGELLCKGNEE